MQSLLGICGRSFAMTGLAIVLTGVVGCAAQGSDASTAGRRFNLPLRTLGGAQLWADVAWSDGWRVQRHVWTRHHRVLDDSNVRRGWGDEAHCRGLLEENADRSGTGHAVVLLHGLGRTRYSLGPLRRGLEEQGYQVVSLSYPSTRASLDEHAASVARVLDGMHGVERVSFVTHSLGGRVVLRVLERDDAWRERIELGRVVQLAPPNQGSRFAAKTRRVPPVGWVLGPSLLELADGNSSPALNDVEVGVISGARGKPYGWNPLLLEDDDGVVGLSETCPQFPHEHKTVRGFHTVLMNDAEVIGATSRFLAQGTFEAR